LRKSSNSCGAGLLLDEGGQLFSLGFELGTKRGEMSFDELIEKCFFLVGDARMGASVQVRPSWPMTWFNPIMLFIYAVQ